MERLTFLRYFAQYLDYVQQPTATPRRSSFVEWWVRTLKAISMQLDSNTLQVTLFVI